MQPIIYSILNRLSKEGSHPELITKLNLLNSPEEEVRIQAREGLFDRIYHQGDIGDVAPLVIPFFIDRLDRETEPSCLNYLLIELGCLASASSRDLSWLEECEDNYTKIEWTGIAGAIKLFKETQSSLSNGINRYCQLLDHELASIRHSAVYLLMYCQFQLDYIVEMLLSRFRRESDENIKSLIVFGFIILSDRNHLEVDTLFLNDILNSDQPDLVKLSAAIALAYIEEENISTTAFARLLDLSKTAKIWEDLECNDSALPFKTLYFVSRLNDEQMSQLIDAILEGWDLSRCVDELIPLVFRCDDEDDFWEERDINEIPAPQLNFLKKVAMAEKVSYNSTLGNLLRTFGLSGGNEQNRESLIQLLDTVS
jgi:hypothetical protein